jgi:hypothetical protein
MAPDCNQELDTGLTCSQFHKYFMHVTYGTIL